MLLAAAGNVAANCQQSYRSASLYLITELSHVVQERAEGSNALGASALSGRVGQNLRNFSLLYRFFNLYRCILQATKIEEECSLVKKSLLLEGFEETLAHRFAILLCVSDIGENLG